ncbi:MAG: S8 family serine peptidase [candidate division WOR-3 bacterium]
MRNVLTAIWLLASVAMAANPFRPSARGVFAPQPGSADFEVGFWDHARFDPLVSQPQLPPALTISAYPGDGTGYYLVQFSGPVRREQIDGIRRAGGNPVGFHSRYLAFVRMNSLTAAGVAQLPFVRWVGVYQPGLKFWSGTLEEQWFGRVAVILFYPEDVEAAAGELARLGCTVARTGVSSAAKVVEVDCSRDLLPAIARLPWVFSIEEWHEPQPENSDAQWVVQDWTQNVRRVWDQSIFGEDEILGFSDGRLDFNHNAFRDPQVAITDTGEYPTHRKVVVLKRYPAGGLGSYDSHGTHVAGTIAGNDSVNGGASLHDGHSKSARIVQLFPIPQPPGNDFTEPLNIITDYLRNPELRPRTISNSWWTGTMGQYTNAASTFDLFAWKNKDVVLIKSCGNQGQTSQYRITEPGNSKSVVACASLQNGLNATVLSTYSSRGPAPDGRIKPDISAPGENIYSAQSGSTGGYVAMSGTSMAAPCVNGNIGLMRSYLRKGFYPSGSAVPTDTWGYVSAALLKAMTLVSADPDVGSYVVPSEYIGWGRMDVDSVLYFATPTQDTRKLLVYDDTVGLETGDYVEFQFHNADSMTLRAGVVWTDTAAAAGANPALINNLDCRLVAPNGDIFKGNLYSGGQSVRNPPGAYDALNPLEMFRVNSADTGTWVMRVEAQNVVTARQPFAVVITGAVSVIAGSDVGVLAIAAPVGSIDSGTSVIPACTTWNYGPTAETYEVRMRIGGTYDTVAQVSAHLPGTAQYLEFAEWIAEPVGTWAVVCSTMLSGDVRSGNDRKLDSVQVRPLTGVAETGNLPGAFALDYAGPSLFRQSAVLRYALPRACRVSLAVYDASGTFVRELAGTTQAAGFAVVRWDGRDSRGMQTTPGVYYCRMQAGDFSAIRKLVRLD